MIWRRFLTYFAAVVVVSATLAIGEAWFPGFLRIHELRGPAEVRGTSEFSPVEILQAGSLLVSGVLMLGIARRSRTYRVLAIGIGGTSLVFLNRELDYFLDLYVFENFWEALLVTAGALLLTYLFRQQKRLRLGFARAWPSPGLTLMFAGLTVLLGFSLILGQESLWQSMLGDQYVRAGALAGEEFMELAGYLLWLIGNIEFALEIRASRELKVQP